MKLDIPIILIDESVVDYGFRVLMSGYQPQSFEKNPVLLLQHGRVDQGCEGVTSNKVMPLGKWNDVKVQGNKLVAFPEFDDDDPDAMKVGNKVKKGYYNAASVWLEPIELSDDDNLKLPGQYGPTFTKWCIREASIVDIPNCRNAVAIRNGAGTKIKLDEGSDARAISEVNDYLKTFLPKKEIQMDLKLAAVAIGLPETATEQEYNTKLAAIVAENKLAAQYKADKETAEAEVARLKKEASDSKITGLVDKAISDKKLAAGDRDKFIKLATADYATTEEVINGMKPYQKIEGNIGGGNDEAKTAEVASLMKLSFDELFAQEKLERLKALDIESFKLKYKEGMNKEYKG